MFQRNEPGGGISGENAPVTYFMIFSLTIHACTCFWLSPNGEFASFDGFLTAYFDPVTSNDVFVDVITVAL